MFLVETKTLTMETLIKEFIINLILSVFFFGFHALVIMMSESDWNEFSLKKLILWIFLYAVVFQVILLILSNRIENALSERNYSLEEIKSFKDAANSDIFAVCFGEGTLLGLLPMVYVSVFHLFPFLAFILDAFSIYLAFLIPVKWKLGNYPPKVTPPSPELVKQVKQLYGSSSNENQNQNVFLENLTDNIIYLSKTWKQATSEIRQEQLKGFLVLGLLLIIISIPFFLLGALLSLMAPTFFEPGFFLFIAFILFGTGFGLRYIYGKYKHYIDSLFCNYRVINKITKKEERINQKNNKKIHDYVSILNQVVEKNLLDPKYIFGGSIIAKYGPSLLIYFSISMVALMILAGIITHSIDIMIFMFVISIIYAAEIYMIIYSVKKHNVPLNPENKKLLKRLDELCWKLYYLK